MDVLDYIYINGERKAKPLPATDAKTDVNGYYKTPTGAVISKDTESLQAYKLRKRKNAELNTMKKEISDLKQDLTEIKELLKGLIK